MERPIIPKGPIQFSKPEGRAIMLTIAPTRDRNERALLIFDMMQSNVYGENAVHGAQDCVRFIEGELRYFRERGRNVISLVTSAPGVLPSPIVESLSPRSHEHLVYKQAPDAFLNTGLHDLLRAMKVTRLTMTGVGAASSILMTAATAINVGYEVVVPEPCIADDNTANRDAALHFIRNVWAPRPMNTPVVPMVNVAAS